MQLLDHLGYGLVSVSSSPHAGAGEITGGSAGHAVGKVDACSDRAGWEERIVDTQQYQAQVNDMGYSQTPAGTT